MDPLIPLAAAEWSWRRVVGRRQPAARLPAPRAGRGRSGRRAPARGQLVPGLPVYRSTRTRASARPAPAAVLGCARVSYLGFRAQRGRSGCCRWGGALHDPGGRLGRVPGWCRVCRCRGPGAGRRGGPAGRGRCDGGGGRVLGLPSRMPTDPQRRVPVNDATAITAFRVALAAVVGAGHDLVPRGSAVPAGGARRPVVVGCGRFRCQWLRPACDRRPAAEQREPAAPFVAYAAAEQVHASGVSRSWSSGCYLGHRATEWPSPPGLQERRCGGWWTFLLESAVFRSSGCNCRPSSTGIGAYAGAGPSVRAGRRARQWSSSRGSCGCTRPPFCPAALGPGAGAGGDPAGTRRSSSPGPACAAWSRWPPPSPSR